MSTSVDKHTRDVHPSPAQEINDESSVCEPSRFAPPHIPHRRWLAKLHADKSPNRPTALAATKGIVRSMSLAALSP